jgi:hypothetical protein
MNNRGRASSRLTRASVLHMALLQAWECTVPPRSATYVSGPITTGPRFVEWCKERSIRHRLEIRQNSDSFRRCVVEPNEHEVRQAAKSLRDMNTLVVIEPASLSIEGWGQADYHLLWELVIERFIARILLLDGWEFSKGCV